MMKSDQYGCSTCKPGEEQYEDWLPLGYGSNWIQYDYRDFDGELFSTVKKTLSKCREARDQWLQKKGEMA